MADVGDFEDFPECECPYVARALPPQTPTGSDVGDFEAMVCVCPTFGLLAALAVAGRVVRVVFSEAPVFSSAAGLADAMNPANYSVTVDAGDASNPVPLAVDPALIVGPARGVGNGGATAQRGVDLHVDRPFAVGVVYRVHMSGIAAASGHPLGALSAPFGGIVKVARG